MELTNTTQQVETSAKSNQLNWNNVLELVMIQGLAAIIVIGIFTVRTWLSL